jgi:hypothetical protein
MVAFLSDTTMALAEGANSPGPGPFDMGNAGLKFLEGHSTWRLTLRDRGRPRLTPQIGQTTLGLRCQIDRMIAPIPSQEVKK